jgi:hypothetical protein
MNLSRIFVLAVLCAAALLLSTAGVAAAAAEPDVDWSATFGGAGDEWANAVVQTTDGGYVMVGGKIVGDQGDVVLVKTDASGNQQWSRTFGGSDWDGGHAVLQAADGGYVIAGATDSVTLGQSKGWLFKTDASGNQQWSKTFGGGDWDHFDSLLQAPDGGYVIAGFVDSMGDADGDVWLLKTDASGTQQWSRTFGGAQEEHVDGLIRTADGGFALAGVTQSSGPGDAAGWFLKTDSAGNQTWARTYGGSGWNELYSVQQTGDGGYVLAGESDSIDPGDTDAWVIRTDTSGAEVWSETYGGVESDHADTVFVLPGGDYLVAGATESQGAGDSDLWLFTVNPSGDRLWDLVYGGTDYDHVVDGTETADGGYILAGETFSVGAGGEDMWLVKILGGQAPGPAFVDIARSPYADAINTLAGAGIIAGYSVGGVWEFRPDSPLWRAQFAKMIVGALGLPVDEGMPLPPFTDLGTDKLDDLYPHEFVAGVYDNGITKGTTATTFGPYTDLTRAQLITMVVRAVERLSPATLAGVPAGWHGTLDASDGTHGPNIAKAEYNGLLDGIGLGGWSVWGKATRGETAQVMYNMMLLIAD